MGKPASPIFTHSRSLCRMVSTFAPETGRRPTLSSEQNNPTKTKRFMNSSTQIRCPAEIEPTRYLQMTKNTMSRHATRAMSSPPRKSRTGPCKRCVQAPTRSHCVPVPLARQCSCYVPGSGAAHHDSCEISGIAGEVWRTDAENFIWCTTGCSKRTAASTK